MTKQTKPSPESSAKELLERCAIQGVPVPVEKIAKTLGAQVRYSPLDQELSGMVFVKDGVPIIGVNSLHHPNRQRFTIAHEIGHLCLHRELITANVHVDKQFAEVGLRRDANSASGLNQVEIEANQFAAALLMPEAALEELLGDTPIDIEDESSLDRLSKKLKVSKATLQYRIRNLEADRGT